MKISYSGGGGESFIINRQDEHEFSYTVALENVKDCLKYTKIGGLYVLNRPQQWKLLKYDPDLFQLVDACKSGGELDICGQCC